MHISILNSWVVVPLLLGFFLQAVLLLRRYLSAFKAVMLLLILSAGFFVFWFLNPNPSLVLALIFAGFLMYFLVTYVSLYKHRILPVISRRGLIAVTSIFWYLFLTRNQLASDWMKAAFYISVLFSVMILVVTFLDWPLHAFWKASCYLWFLILTAYFCFIHFQFPAVLFSEPETWLNFGEIALFGMAIFYLAFHCVLLLGVIPYELLDKNKTAGYALWEWRIRNYLLIRNYGNDRPVVVFDTIIVAIIFSSCLWLNKIFGIVSDQVVVDSLILWTAFVFDNNT